MSLEQGSNPLDNIDLSGLFNSIESEYNRGGKFGLDNPQQDPAENAAFSNPELSATYITRFFADKLPGRPFRAAVRRGEDIKEFADYINKAFHSWQVNAHKHTDKREDEELVRRLTLDDLALFASDRFDNFIKESGRAVPFSIQQKSYQNQADYWAWAGQVIVEAIEQNKKKP